MGFSTYHKFFNIFFLKEKKSQTGMIDALNKMERLRKQYEQEKWETEASQAEKKAASNKHFLEINQILPMQ